MSASDLAALTDGQNYTVTASAINKAGIAASTSSSITLDESASLSINPIDGNNFITASNVANGIAIKGTSADSILANLVGQVVTVGLNGKTYTGTIGSDGNWSVDVSPADLVALTNGKSYTVTASVTDLAGNKASGTDKVVVDETAALAIKAIDGNGFVNGKNAAAGITISGTSTGGTGNGDFAGQTVAVVLNGQTYSGTIANNGTWSVSVSASDLAALTDGQNYTVTASAINKAGIAASTSSSITLDESASLSINPIDGNNFITASNVANGIAIKGTSADSILANLVGQVVTVGLNGKTYTGTIGSDGNWSVDVSPADLVALTNGKSYTVTASVTDLAGNKASGTDKVIRASCGSGYADVVHGRPLPEPDQVLGHGSELRLRRRARNQRRGRTLLPDLQGTGHPRPHLPDHRRCPRCRAEILRTLQRPVAHREKRATQPASNAFRLGASRHEERRLNQTCVQRTGRGTQLANILVLTARQDERLIAIERRVDRLEASPGHR